MLRRDCAGRGARPAGDAGPGATRACARGHHHGRQRALGRGARAAAPGGASRGEQQRPRGDPDRAPHRRPGADALRVLGAELVTSGGRGRGSDGPAPRVPRVRAAGDPRERHPAGGGGGAGPSAAVRPRTAGGSPRGVGAQPGDGAHAGAELRRAGGDCSGGRRARRAGPRRVAAAGPRGRRDLRLRSLDRAAPAGGPGHPDQRRDAGEQLPPVAVGLRGVHLRGYAVARVPGSAIPGSRAGDQQRERRFGLTSAQLPK